MPVVRYIIVVVVVIEEEEGWVDRMKIDGVRREAGVPGVRSFVLGTRQGGEVGMIAVRYLFLGHAGW